MNYVNPNNKQSIINPNRVGYLYEDEDGFFAVVGDSHLEVSKEVFLEIEESFDSFTKLSRIAEGMIPSILSEYSSDFETCPRCENYVQDCSCFDEEILENASEVAPHKEYQVAGSHETRDVPPVRGRKVRVSE